MIFFSFISDKALEAVADSETKKGLGVINSLKLLAKTESIFLDPIYTAKCMDGMIKYINENKYSDENNLVFIHSGGLPNLFTYSNELIK